MSDEGANRADAAAATLLVHDDAHPWGAVTPPVAQTSLFVFPSVAAMEAAFDGTTPSPIYSRGDNPTVRAFERKVARLERAESARAFSSGMGAISAAVLSQVQSGDRMVAVRNVYPDAYRLFEKLLPRLGVTVDYVDGSRCSRPCRPSRTSSTRPRPSTARPRGNVSAGSRFRSSRR